MTAQRLRDLDVGSAIKASIDDSAPDKPANSEKLVWTNMAICVPISTVIPLVRKFTQHPM